MSTLITIGRRGAVTLPAKLRKRYALKENDSLIIEEVAEGLLLRPAVSMPTEIYSEERIAEFAQGDAEIAKLMDSIEKR